MAPKAERKPTSLPSPASSGPHHLSDLVHHSLPLAHPIPAILDFSQTFKHIIHRPTPGPLHWLFPLPRVLFPKLQTWVPPSLPSGLYLMCPFQGVFLCPLCLKYSPHHSQCLLDPLLLPFPHTFHYLKHLIFYSLLLPFAGHVMCQEATCQVHLMNRPSSYSSQPSLTSRWGCRLCQSLPTPVSLCGKHQAQISFQSAMWLGATDAPSLVLLLHMKNSGPVPHAGISEVLAAGSAPRPQRTRLPVPPHLSLPSTPTLGISMHGFSGQQPMAHKPSHPPTSDRATQ